MPYKILGEPFPVLGGFLGNPTGRLPYSQRVLNTQPDNLIQYLPLSEPAGSVNAIDLSPEGNDGVYNTVTLGIPGIGDGLTAARLNGVAGYVNIYSAALNADFDGAEGTILIWGRVDAAVWTDAIFRHMNQLRADGNNGVIIRRSNLDGQLQFIRAGADVVELIDYTTSVPITYFMAAMTWSEAVDEVKAYYFDDVTPFAQVGVTEAGLGAYVGNLSNVTTLVGASTQAGGSVWEDDLAHHAVWNIPLTEAELRNLSIR